MKKYIKYIIIIGLIIGIILGLRYLLTPSMDTQIKNYLIKKGYSESEYENLLEKNESNKKKSFSLADYTFMLNITETNSYNSVLNATYDYKDDSLIYSYRIKYSDSVNVWFKGSYNDDKFVCEKEYSNASLNSSNIDTICNLINTNIKIFDLEAKTLFSKYKYVDYMKKK